MKQFIEELWRLILIAFLGTAGSMVAGLMMYGGDIFNPSGMPFVYYLAYGFSSACIFAFYHVRGLSNTISTAMVFGAVLFLGIAFILPIIFAAIYSFGVTVSVVVLAFLFERKLSTFRALEIYCCGHYFRRAVRASEFNFPCCFPCVRNVSHWFPTKFSGRLMHGSRTRHRH